MDGEIVNDSPWYTYCWLQKHSTCCAYGLRLCVHMCAYLQYVCVSACTKDLFCKKTVCAGAFVCLLMSYSFSLAHNNMCVSGGVYTDTFSSSTSKLCAQLDMYACASHYFHFLLTKWNPVLAIFFSWAPIHRPSVAHTILKISLTPRTPARLASSHVSKHAFSCLRDVFMSVKQYQVESQV